MNIIRLNSIGEPFAKSGQATPPSGGGTEGGDCLEYVDTSNPDFLSLVEIGVLSHVVKLREDDGTIVIAAPTQILTTDGAVDSNRILKIIAFCFSPKVRMKGGVFGEIGYTIAEMGGELLANAPRLTKEEFYTL